MKIKTPNIAPLILLGLLISCNSSDKPIESTFPSLSKSDSSAFNLANFEVERSEIRKQFPFEIFEMSKFDSLNGFTNDMINTAPNGVMNLGWTNEKRIYDPKTEVHFTNLQLVPNTEIIRVYNEGKTAIRNALADVTLQTPIGKTRLPVLRTDIFIKTNDKWFWVGGHGSESYDYFERTIKSVLYPVVAFIFGLLLNFFYRRFFTKQN
jgi:hypothetical protein